MRILVIAIVILILGGCTANTPPPPSDFVGQCPSQPAPEVAGLSTDNLLQQYAFWEGTRYRVGGLSHKGIDCSGFVYLTFQKLLGIELPRSANQQATMGKDIPEEELRTGDLVFFKTGRRGRHVGIYLDEGRFIHASTTKGVTISSLSDRYWSKRYWKATRV